MTDNEAVQKIADVLHARAQDAGTDRGIKTYRRRAKYLLSIDRRLDERFEAVADAAFRGEAINFLPEIKL